MISIVLTIIASYLLSSTYAQDITAQNEGLYRLYSSMGGEYWAWRQGDTPWVFEDSVIHDPCAEGWAGINCSETQHGIVSSIILEEYNLTGSLPTSYAGLEPLELLDIGYNSIYGNLPEALGELVNIKSLSLGLNSLEGSFPSCFNDLSNLEVIDVIGNKLTGPVPEFLSSINSLSDIYVGENKLTGLIPGTISSMTNLQYLYFTKNQMNGTIPYEFGTNLRDLYYLGLSSNSFTGLLPESFGSLQELRYLMLNGNKIAGTIPLSIGNLTNLEFFEANKNEFTGGIPEVFGNLINLFAVEICDNYISGTLPTSLGNLVGIDTLYLDANYISGPLPRELGNLKNLTSLLLYDNMLSGLIPSELGTLHNLQELSLYKNRLSGYIPESVTNMPELVELVLQNNRLQGFECLEKYGNHNCEFNMPKLQRLDISDNKLEGSVPMQIFHLSALRSVALVNGCFRGKLKDDICLATNLEVLSLDGLTSGAECRKDDYLDTLSLRSGYIVKHYMEGSLPNCVWHMPNLTVLHIAGNGFTGTLPSLSKESKLINVSVAYNKISGTIPKDVQIFPFVEFCIAYNKISGEFASSLPSNDITKRSDEDEYDDYKAAIGSVVSVEVNRLSGYIPKGFERVGTLNALNGNFFNCDGDHSLPENDEESSYYICGSKNLDQSLVVWAVVVILLVIFIIAVALIRYKTRKSKAFMSSDIDTVAEANEDEIFGESVNAGSSIHEIGLLREYTLSLHTSPGSFDDSSSGDYLLRKESSCQAGKYKYYSRHSSLNKVIQFFVAAKNGMVDRVSMWIVWFEETMVDRPSDITSPTKNQASNRNGSGVGNLKDLKVFISLLCMTRRSSLLITGIIVIICVPMYLLLKLVWPEEYSTHSHQYGWLVSAAFLSGITPAICILLIFLLLCGALAYSLVMLYPTSVGDAHHYVRLSMLSFPRDSEQISLANIPNNGGIPHSTSNSNLTNPGSPEGSLNQSSYFNLIRGRSVLFSTNDKSKKSFFTVKGTKQVVVFSGIFTLNVLITLSVYGLYVYGFDTSTRYGVKVSMKVVLALFQISWNLVVIPKTVEYIAHLVDDSSSRVKWLITLCLSFNYIIAPATGGLLSSSTCFADYFKEQPRVLSFYKYDICRAYSLDMESNTRFCTEISTASFETSFIPPFMYYYQCSSTLITTYVAVLMLEHAIIAIGPITLVWLLSYESSVNYVPGWVIRSVPSIVWPPQYRPAETNVKSFPGAILRPDRMIAAFMSHFVILITYGLADPFLAVAICIATCSLTVLAQVLIGRYMHYYRLVNEGLLVLPPVPSSSSDNSVVQKTENVDESVNSERIKPLETMNAICSGILNGLPKCLWTIIIIGSFFMSAIIADMASDKVTWEIGIYVGLPAFIGPFVAFFTLKYALYASYK